MFKKKILASLLIVFFVLISCSSALAATQVKGHYRKDGTYVRPHTRNTPSKNTKSHGKPVQNYDDVRIEPEKPLEERIKEMEKKQEK